MFSNKRQPLSIVAQGVWTGLITALLRIVPKRNGCPNGFCGQVRSAMLGRLRKCFGSQIELVCRPNASAPLDWEIFNERFNVSTNRASYCAALAL
jgi:hypothetical protein